MLKCGRRNYYVRGMHVIYKTKSIALIYHVQIFKYSKYIGTNKNDKSSKLIGTRNIDNFGISYYKLPTNHQSQDKRDGQGIYQSQ